MDKDLIRKALELGKIHARYDGAISDSKIIQAALAELDRKEIESFRVRNNRRVKKYRLDFI